MRLLIDNSSAGLQVSLSAVRGRLGNLATAASSSMSSMTSPSPPNICPKTPPLINIRPDIALTRFSTACCAGSARAIPIDRVRRATSIG